MDQKIVEHYITNNYTQGRPGQSIDLFFVLHTYNGYGTFLGKQGESGWFQNNPYGVSANNCILKDGTREKVVRRQDTAHHAGNWWANVNSIGYEHQDDFDPSDKIRTDEQYEASARAIAEDAIEMNQELGRTAYSVLNASNIHAHWEYTETGCPGGLDIDRIRNRANEILQNFFIPDWKKEAVNIGDKNFKPEKSFSLVEIDTGKVIGTYDEGTSVTVKYKYKGYYVTEYSYNSNAKNGFKVEDLEYVKPIPQPDTIVYEIWVNKKSLTSVSFNSKTDAKLFYDIAKIKPGDTKDFVELNITKSTATILESYTEPIVVPPEPTNPKFNLVEWIINLFIKIFKRK